MVQLRCEGKPLHVICCRIGAKEDPMAGRREARAFVYGDGTRLVLTDTSLAWPQGSMLEGAVFTATGCPQSTRRPKCDVMRNVEPEIRAKW